MSGRDGDKGMGGEGEGGTNARETSHTFPRALTRTPARSLRRRITL